MKKIMIFLIVALLTILFTIPALGDDTISPIDTVEPTGEATVWMGILPKVLTPHPIGILAPTEPYAPEPTATPVPYFDTSPSAVDSNLHNFSYPRIVYLFY